MSDNSPYAPPRARVDVEQLGAGPPPVWRWYVAYCIVMATIYVVVIVLGVVFLAFAEQMSETGDVVESYVMGAVFVVISVPLAVFYVAVPLLPKRRFAWIVGFVAIGIGMTSTCFLPAALPLLLYWMKDETKAFFDVSGTRGST
jgi:membrane protease YdiL (CAAX protease family)